MKIGCENCSDAFRVDDSQVTEEGVVLLCPYCSYPHKLRLDLIKPEEENPSGAVGDGGPGFELTTGFDVDQSGAPEEENSGMDLINLQDQTGAHSDVIHTAQERIRQAPSASSGFSGRREAMERERKAAEESGAKILHLFFFVALAFLVYANRETIMRYLEEVIP